MSAVLLPALVTMICIPLVAAFAPVFEGGVLTNLGRAFDEPRFIRSFSYGLSQAFVSSLLAAAIGIPAAFLLARRKFPGKRVLSALSAIPFCVPPLIIAIGFVLYYGREGMLNKFLMHVFGLSEAPVQFLYSFSGVVMAHGFYNFPIVMRFVADAWATVPKAHGDAARLLGASEIKVFLTITLPSILPALGAAMSLVFLMCFYSFVIVLLFGGPGVGTPEVELYRAARFSFDRPLASAFALMETMVAMAVLALYAYFENKTVGERRVVEHAKAIPFQSAVGVVFAILFGIFITIFFSWSTICNRGRIFCGESQGTRRKLSRAGQLHLNFFKQQSLGRTHEYHCPWCIKRYSRVGGRFPVFHRVKKGWVDTRCKSIATFTSRCFRGRSCLWVEHSPWKVFNFRHRCRAGGGSLSILAQSHSVFGWNCG